MCNMHLGSGLEKTIKMIYWLTHTYTDSLEVNGSRDGFLSEAKWINLISLVSSVTIQQRHHGLSSTVI